MGCCRSLHPTMRHSGEPLWVYAAGTAFSRWTTEATVMQEFKQYGHYMQPRIHKMVQEVRPRESQSGAVLLHCQDPYRLLRAGIVVAASRWHLA